MKKKAENVEKVEKARELGRLAFERGAKSIPALDPELLKLLEGNKLGEGLPILEAWTNGWHKANLAVPVPGLEEFYDKYYGNRG